jgi:hypothetical protein
LSRKLPKILSKKGDKNRICPFSHKFDRKIYKGMKKMGFLLNRSTTGEKTLFISEKTYKNNFSLGFYFYEVIKEEPGYAFNRRKMALVSKLTDYFYLSITSHAHILKDKKLRVNPDTYLLMVSGFRFRHRFLVIFYNVFSEQMQHLLFTTPYKTPGFCIFEKHFIFIGGTYFNPSYFLSRFILSWYKLSWVLFVEPKKNEAELEFWKRQNKKDEDTLVEQGLRKTHLRLYCQSCCYRYPKECLFSDIIHKYDRLAEVCPDFVPKDMYKVPSEAECWLKRLSVDPEYEPLPECKLCHPYYSPFVFCSSLLYYKILTRDKLYQHMEEVLYDEG